MVRKRITKANVQMASGQPKKAKRKQKRGGTVVKQQVRAPIAQGIRLSTRAAPDLIKAKGRVLVATIPIATNIEDGTLLFTTKIAPQAYFGGRLATLSKAYARYRFTKFSVTVATKLPSTVAGGYIIGLFRDSETTLEQGSAALKNQIMSADTSSIANWWMSTTLDNGLKKSMDPQYQQGWYTTSSAAAAKNEPHSIFQGMVAVCVDGALAAITGVAGLSMTVTASYEIEFWEATSRLESDNPALEPISIAVPYPGVDMFQLNNGGNFYIIPNDQLEEDRQQVIAAWLDELYDALELRLIGPPAANFGGVAKPVIYNVATPFSIPTPVGATGLVHIVSKRQTAAGSLNGGINAWQGMTSATQGISVALQGGGIYGGRFGAEQGQHMTFYPVYFSTDYPQSIAPAVRKPTAGAKDLVKRLGPMSLGEEWVVA
jgi:hypothetical protein